MKQGFTQQPCTFLVVCCFPRATEHACAPPRSASPKVRCRGVVSLSWDARWHAPLRKQGGQARRARSKQQKLLKNKNKNKQQAQLNRSRRADRDESSSRKCCAPSKRVSNKDACVHCARARKRMRAQISQGGGRRRRGEPVVVVNRQPPLPLRQQVVRKQLLKNMITEGRL